LSSEAQEKKGTLGTEAAGQGQFLFKPISPSFEWGSKVKREKKTQMILPRKRKRQRRSFFCPWVENEKKRRGDGSTFLTRETEWKLFFFASGDTARGGCGSKENRLLHAVERRIDRLEAIYLFYPGQRHGCVYLAWLERRSFV
jgi:hypothetical protein